MTRIEWGIRLEVIADLRMHMASATTKNPLHMIDDFEMGYAHFLYKRTMGQGECPQMGTGGSHSENFLDGSGSCVWCGAVSNHPEKGEEE